MTENAGALAAALAKAQVKFGPVSKSKTVTVQKKQGGSYSFAYAPLDTILDAVRKPLADNGLVVVQILDDGDLVTSLLHESGAIMSGRVGLPPTTDVQAYGSAITYLRRYAIQALLGIAAEDDDDGNRSAGNSVTFGGRREETTHDDGLVGTAELGKGDADFELRQTPDGRRLAFRLVQGRKGYKVIATGDLAGALATLRPSIEGQRVTVWGTLHDETFTPKGQDRPVTYQVVHAERIATPDGVIPAPAGETTEEDEAHPEAESLPMLPLDEEERALVGGARP